MSVEPETLKRIRRIELRTRHLVNDSFGGAYHSVFKGKGIVFDSVRPYQPGDDVRDIDWHVTARAGDTFVKQYAEERELTVMLMLDTSASCLFGTVKHKKRDIAAELGAVLTLAANTNNDKVGLIIFSNKVERYTAPRKGRNHVLTIIRDLLAVRSSEKATDLSHALRAVNQLLKQKAIIFLMSDFLASPNEYERDLRVVSRKHDLIAFVLRDPRETSWPDVGMLRVKDSETGVKEWIDTSSNKWQDQFIERNRQFEQLRNKTLRQAGVDTIDMPVDGDYVGVLTQFFQKRSQHRK